MKNWKINKIKGGEYLIILFIYRMIIVVLADAITDTSDGGAKIIGVIAVIPFLLVLLFFAYHRVKRIHIKPGGAFYIFVYSMIHITIFGSSGFQDSGLDLEGQLVIRDSNPLLYWGTLSGPLFAIFAFFYNCMLIFKNARETSNEVIK